MWAEFDSNQGKSLFGVYYRPPSQNKNGLDILDDNLSKIHASGRAFNLCSLVGDFSIHIDWASDCITKGSLPKGLLDIMHSSGFTQVLKDPTYRLEMVLIISWTWFLYLILPMYYLAIQLVIYMVVTIQLLNLF